MKVIDRIEFEYVVPETPEEKAELEATIRAAKTELQEKKFNPADYTLVRKKSLPSDGTWRMK